MKSVLVYIHGYGSTGDSETAQGLRRLLSEKFDVAAPTYNGSNPIEAAMTIEAAIPIAETRNIVLTGTSLGGFFANYFARKHDLPAILINPALVPSQALAEFRKAQPILDAYQRLEDEERGFTAMPPRQLIVGLKDDILDPQENCRALKDVAEVIEVPMGHHAEPAFFGLIAQSVRTMAGTVADESAAGTRSLQEFRKPRPLE